ncbi:MAG: hypothetical protein ACK5MU_01620 [Candidatus Saccharimonadales bacterium]
MTKPNREDIAKLLKERYKLNDIQITNVLEYAYSLSEQRDRANDFALVHYLNERAIALFSLVVDSRNAPETDDVNRSYILITDLVKKIYSRNKELGAIRRHICWQSFDQIGYLDDVWEYANDARGDYGQSHNAEVKRLCIVNGKEKPDIAPDVKKILDEAGKNVDAFVAELEYDEPAPDTSRNWFIEQYSLEHKPDGTILVNGVLKLKKTQAGSAPERLMEQVVKQQNTLFKPNLGQTTRNISTIISSMGFDKTLRALFFPTVSQSKGVIFRQVVNSSDVSSERIDTYKLDTQLQKLGARTAEKPTDLSEIPF